MQTRRHPAPPIFLLSCSAVFAISAACTIHFCRSMAGGMKMPGGWTMSMMWMPMPGCTWAASAEIFLLSWLVMMVAMMLPSAMPMLLNIRRWASGNRPGNFEALALFAAAGYFFVWTLIGAVVYALGIAYAMATMRLDWLSRLTPALSALMLIIAGLIQLSRWKIIWLRRCRAPDCGALLHAGTFRGWRYGFKNGMACGICCAAPMLVLLVLGAMNLAVMTLIAAVIAMEKLLPYPERTARIFGIMALLAGMGTVGRTLFLN
jgi:predicted metal-binding membrane protein